MLRSKLKAMLSAVQENQLILPSGYRRVEYLESTGTQWIDTGFKPNGNTGVEIDVMLLKDTTQFFCGARDGSKVNGFGISYTNSITNGSKYMRMDYRNTWHEIPGEQPINEIMTYSFYNNEFRINGVTKKAIAKVNFKCSYSLYLMANNNGGIIAGQRLYSARIWDNTNLIRDFIPCLNKDNKPCLYDTVSRQAYYNKGTGEFLYGKIIA